MRFLSSAQQQTFPLLGERGAGLSFVRAPAARCAAQVTIVTRLLDAMLATSENAAMIANQST